jgi:hypothetical protein
MTEFNTKIDLLNPTLFVNDKNLNAPLQQLLANDEYVLKFLNGNRLVLKSFLGNLFDYNDTGEKILSNSGRFDSYKKCNTWKALKSFAINNDEDIMFDEANEMLVYKGYCDTADCLPDYNVNRETWIEREVFVPEILRGQQIVFGIKAAPFPEVSGWSVSGSMSMPTSGFETIAVEILNGEQTVREFVVVGPWENRSDFENETFGPDMLSAYIPFRVKPNTKSLRIKIFRTSNENFLHINRMFLGAVTLPFDNDTEQYVLKDIDINNFYDYDNDVAKVTATTVMGRKIAPTYAPPKQNELILLYHLYEEVRKNLISSSLLSGTPNTTLSEHGSINLNSLNRTYTITHHPLATGTSKPQVTLVAPDSNSTLYVQAIYDVQDSQFSVILSDFPENNNYKLNWFIPTTSTLSQIDTWTIPEPESAPNADIYPDIFDYENEY